MVPAEQLLLSAIQVTHVVFTMQSRELYNQVRDAVKFLKLGVPKIDQWICPVFLTGLKLSEIFAQQKFGLNGIFFN